MNQSAPYVLYWMTSFRRLNHNFSLQRAVEHARVLNKPLVIFEALRCDYPWASDRHHLFSLQGMRDNAMLSAEKSVFYYPYAEPEPGAGRGLLEALATHAAIVVSDDFPCFFIPRMQQAAAEKLNVRLELVDSNGLMPMRIAQKAYPTAYAFRRYLQKELPEQLVEFPEPNPLEKLQTLALDELPDDVLKRWPALSERQLSDPIGTLKQLPIDHDVTPVSNSGGPLAAQTLLREFIDQRLDRYGEEANRPEENVTSGLSPYLHWGHISAHEIFNAVVKHEHWSPARLSPGTRGKREGWWGMSSSAERFLDQLITWRELGYNYCALRDDYAEYDSLPGWALSTLSAHEGDEREYAYSLEQFEAAQTHDALWNAAQMQLVREGHIHNYLRMLWGKKIMEWTRSPREALEIMIHLNNKYGLDGRNPNSYSGILWCFGRYDRPWQERAIFGKVRYMTSKNTARKVRVQNYIEKYAPESRTNKLDL